MYKFFNKFLKIHISGGGMGAAPKPLPQATCLKSTSLNEIWVAALWCYGSDAERPEYFILGINEP